MKKLLITYLLLLATWTSTSAVDREEHCMTVAIYHEARGEPYLGMLAVGQVIKNRVEHPKYPRSICDVVYQPRQFSWVGKRYRLDKTSKSWMLAQQATREVLSGVHQLSTLNALNFHSVKLKKRRALRIGGHYFF